jgi:hypothetical protein
MCSLPILSAKPSAKRSPTARNTPRPRSREPGRRGGLKEGIDTVDCLARDCRRDEPLDAIRGVGYSRTNRNLGGSRDHHPQLALRCFPCSVGIGSMDNPLPRSGILAKEALTPRCGRSDAKRLALTTRAARMGRGAGGTQCRRSVRPQPRRAAHANAKRVAPPPTT